MAGEPALVVRVAATLDEFKRNLAENVSQIEVTKASLTKMAASYDGSKIVQQASATAAAIQSIGGASALSATEQAKANTVLEAALEKYRVLGKEAPAGMQALADETRGAIKPHSDLRDTVRGLITDFAAMFTARAAFNFIKQTVDEASALKDLSNETHISVEEIQLLGGAMSEFGVDQETLGKGLYKLSRGIAGGDDSVTNGLHLMGMSLKDVEGLNGQELFLKIEHGLSTLQGGLRDTAAAELFGGKLGAAMAGASEGIDNALATWQRLNTVATTESVDALDQYGEAITRMETSLSSLATNMMGPVAQGFNVVVDAAGKAGALSTFWAMMKDGVGTNGPLSAWIFGTDNLATVLEHANRSTEASKNALFEHSKATHAAAEATDTLSQSEKFLAALQKDAAETLTAAQIKNLETLKELGALNAKNAEGVGVSAAQYAKYSAAVEKATKDDRERFEGEQAMAEESKRIWDEREKQEAAVLLEVTRLQDEYNETVVKRTGTTTDFQIASTRRWADDLTARLVKAGADTAAAEELIGKIIQEKNLAIVADTQALAAANSDLYQQQLRDAADKAQRTYEIARDAVSGFSFEAIAHFHDLALAAEDAASHWSESFVDAGAKAKDAIKSTLDAAKGLPPGTVGVGVPIGLYEHPTAAITFGGLGGIVPGGYRAEGGPVAPGSSYIVGERGPELFMPDGAGTIVPNGGGGTSITIAPGAIVLQYPIMDDAIAMTRVTEMLAAGLIKRLTNTGYRAPSGA